LPRATSNLTLTLPRNELPQRMVYNFLLVDVDDLMREAILVGVIDGVHSDTAPGHDCIVWKKPRTVLTR
jgi:hypothetical protein